MLEAYAAFEVLRRRFERAVVAVAARMAEAGREGRSRQLARHDADN